ncbi:MSCRAMM family protein [Microbacterium sp.]|uniref:MSCRAMM family protein n=1 Tax=Microbacterium sp. TaxID=51671 RepID=UPI002FE08086
MASRRMGRRVSLRALLAGTAVSVLALTGAVSAAADDADPTVTISGTVTREDGGAPVASISVFVNSTDFTKNGAASTDANGDYTVTGLEPGEYTVRFATAGTETGLISEYWDGARTAESATRITAVGGETVTDIDATLQQGASITGRVTRESDGTPISGASVSVSPDSIGASPAVVMTDENGVYLTDGLVPAAYTVKFEATDDALADEYWESAYDQQSATLVPVVAGQVATGIDASLTGAIGFEGTVTRAVDGSPVPGSVSATAASGAGPTFSTPIAPDGSYRLTVGPGVYIVQFISADPLVLSEYLENAYSQADASPVVVASGGGMFEFNPQLETGHVISGVVRSDGQPLEDAIVEPFMDGQPVAAMAYTKQNGEYTLVLPAGDYTVRAYGTAYDQTYAWQYFDGADTAASATVVSLGSSADPTGIDFDLSRGGAIHGAVSGGGAELQGDGATVTAYLWGDGEWNAVTTSNTGGDFVLGGDREFPAENGGLLPAGTYTIGVQAEGFCTQFLGGGATLDDAETIDVVGGQVVTDIDITLATECHTPEPEPKPALALGAGSVRAGGDIAISGTGFAPGEKISFELHSDPIALGSLTADAQGVLKGSLRIPVSAPVGAHTLVALNAQSVAVASAALQVTAASSQSTSGSATGDRLANTGSEAPTFAAMMALGLLAAGLVLARRRRVGG